MAQQDDLYNTPGYKEGRRRWSMEAALQRAVPLASSESYESIDKAIDEAKKMEEYLIGPLEEPQSKPDGAEPNTGAETPSKPVRRRRSRQT